MELLIRGSAKFWHGWR